MEFEKSFVPLQHHLMLIKRRWVPASVAFGLVCAVSAIGLTLKKPTYVAEGKLRFERVNPALSVSVTDIEKQVNNPPPTDFQGLLTSEAEVIRSFPIVSRTIQQLQLRASNEALLKPNEFLKKLRVEAVKESDILTISYRHSDPALSARVVNTLMNHYLEHNISRHRAQAIAARKFIEQQLPKTEKAVEQTEQQLQQLKEENRIISLPEEAKYSVEAAKELQQQVTAAHAQMNDVNAQANAYQRYLGLEPSHAKALVALSQAPGVQQALGQMQQLQTEIANQRAVLQPGHPTLVTLENRLANLKAVLEQRSFQVIGSENFNPNQQMGPLQQELTQNLLELQARRDGLTQQLAAFSRTNTVYQNRTNLLPKLEKEQRNLERQLAASQATYSQLLQRLGEVRIAENQTIGNAQIIAAAQLPDRAASNLIAILATGSLALLIAGVTAYGLEALDQTIKTIEQAKQVFGYTVLGVTPDDSQSKKAAQTHDLNRPHYNVAVEQAPASAIGAAYRILQTNLRYLQPQALQTIVVSSSVPKEGKSTVSANLAAAIAQSGKRVLLIDADLHHPVQHQLWQISNEVGLSHLLVDQAAFGKAAKCVTSNLDVLTAGIKPPNTLALLDSAQMAALINQFSENYDAVILDTPPLTLATDALILGKLADGMVIVTRPGFVKIGSATFAKGLLEQSGQKVLGQVINGVVLKNEPHSHYYFADSFSNSFSDRYATRADGHG